MTRSRSLLFISLGTLAALVWLLMPRLSADGGASSASYAASPPERTAAVDRFGLPVTGFNVDRHRIDRYQTFADLLLDYNVPYAQIVAVAEQTRDVFDVRDFRTGDAYQVYVDPWLGQARYLVYQRSPVLYVVYDVLRPERSFKRTRPVQTNWKTASGVIQSSLYATLMDANASPELALALSEVYAWQIDFFQLRPGDRFRVLYEQQSVDGEVIGPGAVVAAYFEHRGEPFYAFRFDDGTGATYYDRAGQSLQRALLKAPLRYTRISSGFQRSRLHPVLGRRRAHLGTDYAAPTGTPVHSVGDGFVTEAGYGRYNGNYVKIRHNSVYTTGYLHLTDIADGVRAGTHVKQGQVIGYVGSTGLATGPHLHYHFWKNGEPVDSRDVEMPPERPVNPTYRAAYDRLVDRLLPYVKPRHMITERYAPAISQVG